ncbi:MAG: hypothetical protein ACRC0V_03825 [Fusobacteriaceae bacterium]
METIKLIATYWKSLVMLGAILGAGFTAGGYLYKFKKDMAECKDELERHKGFIDINETCKLDNLVSRLDKGEVIARSSIDMVKYKLNGNFYNEEQRRKATSILEQYIPEKNNKRN